MKKNAVIKYFKDKAKDYDLVDDQVFWRLSDQLLAFYLHSFIKKSFGSEAFSFLDAGAGTGRWSDNILSAFKKANATLFDLSPDMLGVAQEKLQKKGFGERSAFQLGNLDETLPYESNSFDLVISFHNVLGFVTSPKKVLQNLSKVTKKGGKLVIMVPNLYHGIYFNIFLNNITEAETIAAKSKGKFTKEMPAVHFFSPSVITDSVEKSGYKVLSTTGFPNFIYPGYLETQIKGQTDKIKQTLENEKVFTKIFEMEKKYLSEKEISPRGANIIITAVKE